MKNKFVKFGAFIISLLTLGSCMMPELKPELYVRSYTVNNSPLLPKASVVKIHDTGSLSFNAYRFVLEWEQDTGGASADADYNVKVVIPALEQAYDVWREYMSLINPLPFYDKAGNGKAPDSKTVGSSMNNPYAVFNGAELDNSSPGGDGNIVIHRYGPKLTDGAGNPMALTRTTWLNSVAARKAAFKQAATEIEAMRAAIQASPLYTMELGGPNVLQSLYDGMAECISHNPPLDQCNQRIVINWGLLVSSGGNVSAELIPGTSGPLYEYYLGHTPEPGDYSSPNPFAFPE